METMIEKAKEYLKKRFSSCTIDRRFQITSGDGIGWDDMTEVLASFAEEQRPKEMNFDELVKWFVENSEHFPKYYDEIKDNDIIILLEKFQKHLL